MHANTKHIFEKYLSVGALIVAHFRRWGTVELLLSAKKNPRKYDVYKIFTNVQAHFTVDCRIFRLSEEFY